MFNNRKTILLLNHIKISCAIVKYSSTLRVDYLKKLPKCVLGSF